MPDTFSDKEESALYDLINEIIKKRLPKDANISTRHKSCLTTKEKEKVQHHLDEIRISTFYRRMEHEEYVSQEKAAEEKGRFRGNAGKRKIKGK